MAEVSRSKPVRLLASVAAGSIALGAGLPLITPDAYDWTGPAAGLLGLVITAGLAKWTEDSVTPNANVAVRAVERQLDGGITSVKLVAEEGMRGIPNGASVDVLPADPANWT